MAKVFFYLGRFLDPAESKPIVRSCYLLSRRCYSRRSDAGVGLRPPSLRQRESTAGAEVQTNDIWRRQTKNHKTVINNREENTHDDRFREIIGTVRSHSKREKLGMSFIVGESLVSEAIRSGSSISEIFYCNQRSLQMISSHSLDGQKVPLHRVSTDSFNKCLNTKLPADGIMAVISLPLCQTHDTVSCETMSDRSLPVTVICDNLRDPGNMGIIIQSAVATSCSRVLVTKGCVDVWEPKVLQVGCGAHFYASIQTGLDWKEIDSILTPETRIFLADSACSKKMSPFSDGVTDSPLLNFDRVDYCGGPVAVIIGGETESVSQEAFQFCRSRQQLSHRVHIPMMESVNSLNSAIAGSVILFEIARQLKLHRQ